MGAVYEQRYGTELRQGLEERLPDGLVAIGEDGWHRLAREAEEADVPMEELDDVAYDVACEVYAEQRRNLWRYSPAQLEEKGAAWVEERVMRDVPPVRVEDVSRRLAVYREEPGLMERTSERLRAMF